MISNQSHDDRPGLAIIANCVTPYRINLHRLIAAGIPDLKLHTLITHGPADFDWRIALPDDIHVNYFGPDDEPVSHTYSPSIREWTKGGGLIAYLKQHDVRAVICALPRYISYLRVVLWCRRAGIPVFVNSDANINSEKSLPLYKKAIKTPFYHWWIKRVAGVMPMGTLGELYFQQYGSERKHMYRVPYTPDYDYYSSVDLHQLSQFRREHELDDGRRYLMYSGRLVQAKRVDLLIDAFVKIADQRPSWDLVIAGDGVLHEQLRCHVPKEVETRVHWLGFLSQERLKLAYHACDVLVLPSDQEPWALVVQEAMAAGLAIVASDAVGAARDLIQDQISGRIFETGNINDLINSLLDVTDTHQIDRYREQSNLALRVWREQLDPVTEICRALADVGVLKGSASLSPVDSLLRS